MQFSLTLGITSLDHTEDFYREILTLSPERRRAAAQFPEFLLVQCGATCIVFQQLEHLQAQHPALLQNLTRQPRGVGVQLELSCPDLGRVRANIDRYQWPVAYELEDSEHQRSEIWLQDPDGYLLVLNEEAGNPDLVI